jgi:EmrB/QacA subfamily drug resistance transporter
MKSSTARQAAPAGPRFEGAPLSSRDKALALAGTLAALLMAGLDQTIVATAGPEIQRELRISAGLYPWITTSYLVASTVMLPVWGKLSDQFGRKPVLLVGAGLFLLGSLLCGVAPAAGLLIAARAIQGVGAASLFTSTLAVIADLYPPDERGKYMGLIGGVMAISSVIGPLVGGAITDLLGWHWVFFVNLPVGLVAMWLIVSHMPAIGGRRGEPVPVDFRGAFWLVACLVPLLVALSLGRPAADPVDGFAWASWPILLTAGWVGFALFAFRRSRRRAIEPILDFSLFLRNRAIGLAAVTMFVLGATFLFSVVFLPLFLVNVVGVSATRAGLSLTPLTLAMVTTSVLSGQLASRFGWIKGLLLAALTLLAAAFAIMGFTLEPGSSQAEVTLKMILIGLGMGPTLPLYTLIVQNAARQEDVGVVTSGAIFARSLGQVIGLALFGSLFATTLAASVAAGTRDALEGLASADRQALAAALPPVAGDGAGANLAFDGAALRESLERSLALGAGAAAAAQAAPAPTAGGGPATAAEVLPGGPPPAIEPAAVLLAIEQLEHAFALALTRAVSILYRIGVLLVLLALGLTTLIPVQPSAARRAR